MPSIGMDNGENAVDLVGIDFLMANDQITDDTAGKIEHGVEFSIRTRTQFGSKGQCSGVTFRGNLGLIVAGQRFRKENPGQQDQDADHPGEAGRHRSLM